MAQIDDASDAAHGTLTGGCHCARIRLAFTTSIEPSAFAPRACDCSFCQKHGAAYISDPTGRLVITLADPLALHRYRQGSNTAEFLICDGCGVLVAVLFKHDARLYGAINARSLDAFAELAPAVPSSPQQLAAEEKVARWLKLWVPDVQLTVSDPRSPADGLARRNPIRT